MTKKFSGAGGLLIEFIDNVPYVILFRCSFTNVYNDLGGSINKEDIPSKYFLELTAMREINEETATTLRINSIDFFNNLMYIDIKKNKHYYRCYIIAINQNFPVREYYTNLKKLQYAPTFFRETSGITHVKLCDLLNCYKSRTCVDVFNRKIIIHQRLHNIIKHYHHIENINISHIGSISHTDPIYKTNQHALY